MRSTSGRTHEEFVNLLSEKFPNVVTEDIYQKAKTKMKFKCKIDGYEWVTTSDSLFHSKGCPKCNGKYHRTNDEFLNCVKLNNSNYNNIEILSEYKTFKGKIHCLCKIDGHEWYPTAQGLMNGSGCPKCGGTLRLTHEDFIERFNQSEKSDEIEIISKYKTQHEKIKCRCKVDNHEWYALPQNLLRGHGCPKCSAKDASVRNTKLHEQFIEEMKNIHPDYIILDEYTSGICTLRYKCTVCGDIRKSTASSLLRGDMCKTCLSISKRKTTEEYKKKLKDKNPNVELISEYNGSNRKIRVKCIKHGCEWDVSPSNALKTTGCHMCNDTLGEKEVSKVLNSLNIKYITQHRFDDCRNIRPLPFDFYLPDYKICIEYDGQQHYRPVTFGGCSKEQAIENHQNTVIRDNIKNKYCEENDIKLIRIKYSDFNNIKNIVHDAIS